MSVSTMFKIFHLRKDDSMTRYLTIISAVLVVSLLFVAGCQDQTPAEKAAQEVAITEIQPQKAPAVVEEAVAEEIVKETPKIEITPAKQQLDVSATEPPAKAVPRIAAPDSDVAVTINGIVVSEDKIQEKIKPQLDRMIATLPPEKVKKYSIGLRQKAMDAIIMETLLDQQLTLAGIPASEENAVEYITTELAKRQPPMTLDDYKGMVETRGGSFDVMIKDLARKLAYTELMESKFMDKTTVTEEDAKKHYDENTQQYMKIRASHILIKPDYSDPNVPVTEVREAATAKAENLLAQIEDGADFAELAINNSEGPSAPGGGDLDFFGKGQMVPAFEAAAFELQPGQVSGIVETKFGFHIIKVTDRLDTFDKAKEKIINDLTDRKKGEISMEFITSLKENAKIVYPEGKDPFANDPKSKP